MLRRDPTHAEKTSSPERGRSVDLKPQKRDGPNGPLKEEEILFSRKEGKRE